MTIEDVFEEFQRPSGIAACLLRIYTRNALKQQAADIVHYRFVPIGSKVKILSSIESDC
jgi:hypothetical protein